MRKKLSKTTVTAKAVAHERRVGPTPNVTPLGHVVFAPGMHPFGMDVVIAETYDALAILCDGMGGADACCIYDHGHKGPLMGTLAFGRWKFTRALVVHEVVHAAMCFVLDKIQVSKQVKAMSAEERNEYLEEAVARLSENLFEQVDALAWPNSEHVGRA